MKKTELMAKLAVLGDHEDVRLAKQKIVNPHMHLLTNAEIRKIFNLSAQTQIIRDIKMKRGTWVGQTRGRKITSSKTEDFPTQAESFITFAQDELFSTRKWSLCNKYNKR